MTDLESCSNIGVFTSPNGLKEKQCEARRGEFYSASSLVGEDDSITIRSAGSEALGL